ncbi:hypothetical protein GCM10008018_53350 [Paenibacillus marchantiophytorum]|uniref:Response regulator n=1 Tax=Paenibacillus marchantiophytorum TaxID=1619310 RepID=A0ABQ1F6U5_9BACL|nr:response regulator [Paenibacillus marchantiophytorum]GGA00319.1 hypothetical protein GCM10008018_53350 [Paenibacillus marchantiophytorum]
MLTMMIVDDEPLAVHYLTETLLELEDMEFEIVKAHSGKEALEKMEAGKVDILLTDIRMPGMSGMELADITRKRWPRCRIIFLTGYDDFSYAQTAIRKGGIDFVLKTEGDEAIIYAVEKAIQDIALEIDREEILQRSRDQLRTALPTIRRDYMLQLIHGETEALPVRVRRFEELSIGLDASRAVLLAIGRMDEWGSFAAPADQSLLFYSVHNIAEEYLKGSLALIALPYDRNRFIWLVQPTDPADNQPLQEQALRSLAGGAELVQAACRRLLKVPVSLMLASSFCSWESLMQRIEQLKLQLAYGVGKGHEMLLTEQPNANKEEQRSSRDFYDEHDLRIQLRKLELLEAYLDNGEKEACDHLFTELKDAIRLLAASSSGEALGYEAFSHLSAFLLTYINKRHLMPQLGGSFRIEELVNPFLHNDPLAAVHYLAGIGLSLADYNGLKKAERTSDMIGQIHHYVHAFLQEELSLTRLAELVYLSPPYLSRMYKQTTGQGLLDYITEVRIQRAKTLLMTSEHKIHEIAALVGLESAPYFTRLFKKITGITPQVYRDTILTG